uniref:GDNF domain-containing protein n=2 Tax=Bursaphelenchus xylophilus TaxID=6326 RepID=A0A1I7SGV8_BURXY
QASLPPEEVHKCCQTKIVLTDQCAPGKCSNGTVQLCCIQKFLQSKFKCCNDRKQADALFATDSFSKCCFENFVQEDDPCCPKSFSDKQWMHVHELCLPNVNIDLSSVKVPQRPIAGMSTVVHYDFSKTDKWRFECRYGGHVPQYSYFTDEAFKSKSKEKSYEE